VNCINDVTLSINRINRRIPNGSRLESMTDDVKERTMKIQKNNFALLHHLIKEKNGHLRMIDIDTSDSLEKNVVLLENLIIEWFISVQ
jgi:hypothetical protein